MSEHQRGAIRSIWILCVSIGAQIFRNVRCAASVENIGRLQMFQDSFFYERIFDLKFPCTIYAYVTALAEHIYLFFIGC